MKLINKIITSLLCILMSFMIYMAGTGEPITINVIEAQEIKNENSEDIDGTNNVAPILTSYTESKNIDFKTSPKISKSTSDLIAENEELIGVASFQAENSIQEETAPTVADDPILVQPDNYNEYFSDSLFVGDSITTGYYVYKKLDESLVVAKSGISPKGAVSNKIEGPDGTLALMSDHIKNKSPNNAIIMLGTNGMKDTKSVDLASYISKLSLDIKSKSPSTNIYICSIPLSSSWYANKFSFDYNGKIKEYNECLKEIADESGYGFIDIQTLLSTDDGIECKDEYIEPDGIHLSPPAYDIMLKYIFESIEMSK